MKRHRHIYNYGHHRAYQGPHKTIKLNLKLEDKVLLGIGAGFIVLIICFMSFASQIFDDLGSSNKPTSVSMKEEIQDSTERLEESWDKIFAESARRHEEVGKAFKENHRKRSEAFKKLKANFHKRFQQAEENFGKKQ